MSQRDLTSSSIVELAALIRGGQVSPVEVITSYLERIKSWNAELNAIVTVAPNVLEQARRAEARLASREVIGLLHGVPLTIKDTIETAGIRSTSGSRVRENYIPGVDATAVQRLKAAGAIILGKTNTPEMAIPYETDNPIFGRTSNPYEQSLTSGGSSGGEASAIAAALSAGGVGSDLSGSIRVPAHFCGVVGLKPTSGRIPMDGHVPVAHGILASGACIGPLARNVADVSLLFHVLAGISETDLPSTEPLKELRVCWYDYDGVTQVSSETKQAIGAAVHALEDAGLKCDEKRPPGIEFGPGLWIELFAGVAANDLREFYSGSEHLAGPLACKILAAARRRLQTPQELEPVLNQRNQLRNELLRTLDNTPLILAPVGATAAFAHDSKAVDVDGQSISVFRAFSYSQTFNVFDLPAVVVRAGTTAAGLPLGVQIIGKPFHEDLILRAAAVVEAALGGWQPPSKHRGYSDIVSRTV